jgi:hypothetical protein
MLCEGRFMQVVKAETKNTKLKRMNKVLKNGLKRLLHNGHRYVQLRKISRRLIKSTKL